LAIPRLERNHATLVKEKSENEWGGYAAKLAIKTKPSCV
jgi:hypothetical protein